MAAAFLLCAATPASARSVTVPVQAGDGTGDVLPGEPTVGTAQVEFPRGDIDADNPLGAFWTGTRARGEPHDCVARVIAVGESTERPLRLTSKDVDLGSLRRARTTVTLTGGGLAVPQRVRADRFVAYGRAPHTLGGWVHFQLPADVLPGFPRRHLYVVVAQWTDEQSSDCPKTTRRAEAVVRSTVRRVSVELPPAYVPPLAPDPPPTFDLAGGGGLELLGTRPKDEAGTQVAAAGDVNGDGLADALVTSVNAGRAKRPHAGAVYVVFGRPQNGTLPLANLKPNGFRIDGPVAGTANFSAAGIGDLDGDGLSEIAVGAPEAGRSHAGAVYVVRGKRDGATVDLARRDDVLYTIGAPDRCSIRYDDEGIGKRVAAAGDANGDGLGDIALVAPDDCGARPVPQAIFVIYGKSTAGDVALQRVGDAGYEVRATGRYELSDVTFSGAGDTNGDGLADLVVGAVGYSGPEYAAIVRGRRGGGVTTFDKLGSRITSDACWDMGAVAGAGDVNGDGYADVAVGTPGGCGDGLGRAYVVFGSPDIGRVNLDELGSQGFAIAGMRGFIPGDSLAGAGDVNGDGLADIALGYRATSPRGRAFAGAVTVVYGKRDSAPIALRNLGSGGYKWLGPAAKAHLGDSVAGLGDFTGDGRPDVIAGMPRLRSFAGGAWVLALP